MFDKLIESDTTGAEFKGRSRYFMVSTVVVGILFITAVVISLYAADIDIGTSEFEMTRLLAPIAPDEPQHEPTKPPESRSNAPQTDEPVRNSDVARTDEPTFAPKDISTVRNTEMARPYGNFRVDPNVRASNGFGLTANDRSIGRTSNIGTTDSTPVKTAEIKGTEPPPAIVKPKTTQSLGVINGRATSLPPPPYPEMARRMNIYGNVDVQVTIDEYGRVISSRAVNGHPLLRGPAEKAAWNARFSPTLLSKQPVKVTGVIVYKFSKN